ncbi:cytochrome P450 [Lentzea sp. NPDC051838]|uniref:cytochrome P450 n=1 Tax=Lentzea sp. NPDC051838 TaxID=3154849 RepID=UPI00342E4CDE
MGVSLVPGRVPLLGHAPALRRDPLRFMRSLRERGDVVRIAIGPRRVYVVNSPELIRRVLVADGRKFDKGALFDQARAHLGNGLVTSSGEFHHRQRRIAQPAFHSDRIAGYAELMIERARARTGAWREGAELELTGEIGRLSLDVLLRCLFAEQPADEVRAVLLRSLSTKQGSMRRALSPLAAWLGLLSRRQDVPERTGMPELHAVLARLVADRRAADDQDDLLSVLLAAPMTDEQLCDELVTLFVAGTETVSAALSWTFHELARHPEIERRLHAEVDEVVGDRPVQSADIGELHYTRRVCQEVLRRYAVWLLMRRAVARVELAGTTLDEGTEVFFSPNAVHHDPALYPDPDVFDPDRWLPERSAGLSRGAYLPFGAGNRLCMGEGFAWTEMAVVLATVAQRWRLVPVPDHEVRTRIGTLVEPDGLPMIPVAR